MRRLVPCVALGLAMPACTIIYDPGDLPRPDGALVDAPPPDAPYDADPAQLEVTAIEPDSVLEGTGGDGGRPATFVIDGDSITRDVVVTAAFTDGAMETLAIEDVVVADDGRRAAVAVRIPVDDQLPVGASRTLRFTLAQAGVTGDADVTVAGLDELTLTADAGRAVTSLAAMYSRITVTGAVHFTGAVPAMLRATGDITLGATLDVDAVGATPGPHGCAGGGDNTHGGCGAGGGQQGKDNSLLTLMSGDGGGGGSFGSAGTDGVGEDGAPGTPTGNDMLVPIVTAGTDAGNRGNGGGGGGAGSLGGAGLQGGSGGGVILIASGADLVVTAGEVSADGGDGASANSKGGGGGGSGGAILVRAAGTITASGPWLHAEGGSGGTAGNHGGDGGLGRIRVDVPGTPGSTSTSPVAVRGPAWAADAPVLVGAPDVTVRLHGEPGRTFVVMVGDDAVADQSINASGFRDYALTLAAGHNEVCAITDATQLARDEARSCIDIVYLHAP
ncbi:MAG: hypothetical protein H6709_15595 [Kofleriaceae bacterium]|nr:hypothetical protein [Kofleriaceae bacterium]MCB9573503.1 hypothetical protein [Kofleriaceae bacterium]